jgi:azurin
VPLLEVAAEARLNQWQESPNNLHRTCVRAEKALSVILGVKSGNLEVRLNGAVVFSSDNRWSTDQQITLNLRDGLNRIELTIAPGKKKASRPAVSLFDSFGRKPASLVFPADGKALTAMLAEFDRMEIAEGRVLRVQSAPGLQFLPRELRVKKGEKVRLEFENPDDMEHNLLLCSPGPVEEIGALADALAVLPEARARNYRPESPRILHATAIVPPKGKAELVFTTPSTPGDYPFVCTLPGHWVVMRGVLVVQP